MLLNRLGNKKRIAEKIYTHFPAHDLYIEPFFGAGGMFFNKPRAKYNIVNDLDHDVFNLYQVIRSQPDQLIAAWNNTPIHSLQFLAWQKHQETDPVYKAVRFLVLSNFSFMGKGNTLLLGFGGNKPDLSELLPAITRAFINTKFTNYDFRIILRKISLAGGRKKDRTFIYCDPPYLNTTNNYSDGFIERDSAELFEMLTGSGIRWAMSEFDHPFIMDTVRNKNLNIIKIGERWNLNNRRTEYLITNF